jgi:Ser/Thr protein kinase RdoA (MazF antagonist)
LIRDLVPAELFELSLNLATNPTPLTEALQSIRCCLIHGDLRPGNVGMENGTAVLIDWGLATLAPPALDLVWYAFNTDALGTIDDGLAAVRAALGGRFEEASIDLAVLTTFIQACPYFGFNAVQEPDPELRATAQRELARWIVQAQTALHRSGHMIETDDVGFAS